jgi:uncharacterized protein (TIGR02145 family)
LINSSFTDQTVTYHITPHANGCDGTVVNYVVTVHPSPDLSNTPPAKSQCNNTGTSLVLTSNVTVTLFTWTASGSSPNVTGFSNNNIPATLINQTLVNIGFNTETVTYHITPVANTCNGTVYPYVVTVFPTPDVQVNPASQTICSSATTNLSLNSDVAAATFTWTATGSSPDVSGYAGGSGNFIRQVLINSGIQMPTVTYQVTSSANGCPGLQNSSIVTVDPRPSVALTPCFDTITTTNAKPVKLKGGIPLGGTYSGAGVTNGIFNPASAGIGAHPITYLYTNAALCSATAIVTIVETVTTFTTCGQNLTDIRDGKTYPTIQIGLQCWMAANLDYGTKISGNTAQRDNCIPEKYCYNDLAADCGLQTYYQWDEIINYDQTVSNQGLCPPAWHIPTETEWNTLMSNYISNGFAGNPLKYSGYSGFNAILTGARHQNVQSDYQNFATFFWSSNPDGLNKAFAHGMNNPDPSVSLYPSLRSNAFSVRCLKDN